jgi:Family of unknown function (DUF5856)
MAAMCGELVMRCFHARTLAHVQHLKTKSYAQHVALQGFYDGLPDLVDQLVEAYQGEYGLIEDYPKKFVWFDSPQEMLQDLVSWIEDHRDEVCDETYCQNTIDEIVSLIRSTQYKLKYLK